MLRKKLLREIERFENLPERMVDVKVTPLCRYGFRIHFGDVSLPDGKEVALSLMAVTHGNEVGGIAVLNSLVDFWLKSGVFPTFTVDLFLGNPQASLKDKRFLERDLNRSFGRTENLAHEDKRARELEPFLSKCCFLLDIHQTIEKCDNPFFIFGYSEDCFRFATSISTEIPVVTHWGKGFSSDGQCGDEFVTRSGGIGITLELGQKGFGTYMESVGMLSALNTVYVVQRWLNGVPLVDQAGTPEQIFTWGEVLDWPDDSAALDEGWYNFREVEAGEQLGNSDQGPIRAGASGPVLFPKYPGQGEPKPAEICRILRRVTIAELGR